MRASPWSARDARPTACDGDEPAERSYWLGALALTGLLFLGSVGWGVTTPAFHGPDETQHVNSVLRVLDGGGWPAPYEARVNGHTWQALVESGSPLVERRYPEAREAATITETRSGVLDTTPLEDRWRDQMVQHPPAYYVITAGTVRALGGESLQWDEAQVVMRVTSAAATAAGLPFLIGVARRLTGSRTAGLVAGTVPFAIPFFVTMGGYVTNDALVFPAFSLCLYAGIRAVDDRRPLLWSAVCGFALGSGLLVKGFLLMAVPVVVLLTLLVGRGRGWSWPRRALPPTFALSIAFVVGGWWWLRNWLTFGVVQPTQYGHAAPLDGLDSDPRFFVTNFVGRFARLFWGRGGDPTIGYPESAVLLASSLLVALIVLGLVVSPRRLLLAIGLVFTVLIVVTIFRNAWSIYTAVGSINRGVQGRYVFGGLAGVAAAVATAWAWLIRRQRRLWAPTTLVGALVIQGLGWAWVMRRLWSADGASWSSILDTSSEALGTQTIQPLVALGAIVCAVLALVALSITASREEPSASVDERMST